MVKTISRREILKSLTAGVTSGSMLKLVSAQAADHVHRMIQQEKALAQSGDYKPKFFSAHQYQTLRTLCQMIVPPDECSNGAIEAGAPEFIDLLTSENEEYQLTLGGGLMWLDSTCQQRYGGDDEGKSKTFLDCSADERKQILDLIAFRVNATKQPELSRGIKFFSLLRNLTTDGFFTSEIGIKDLQFLGNTYVAEFPGCPPVPET